MYLVSLIPMPDLRHVLLILIIFFKSSTSKVKVHNVNIDNGKIYLYYFMYTKIQFVIAMICAAILAICNNVKHYIENS